MITRTLLAAAILVATRLLTFQAGTDHHVARMPLASLPLHIGNWTGKDAKPFEDDVVAALGVDDYVNRVYLAASATPIAVYVGYYANQRQGDTTHSPRNCLPGAGWQPLSSSTLSLSATGDPNAAVNHVLIQKGLDRQIVLYWYAGRTRTTASEYANKWWLTIDAVRLHRTDGGLVRLIAPVIGDSSRATADATAFATLLLPDLPRYLP